MHLNLVCSFNSENYTYSLKEEIPKAVENEQGSSPTVNLALSALEVAALGYVVKTITETYEKDKTPVFLPIKISEEDEKDFKNHLKNFPHSEASILQSASRLDLLRVTDLVNTIWIKSKDYIVNYLQHYAESKSAIGDQGLCFLLAEAQSTEKERVFTPMQQSILLRIGLYMGDELHKHMTIKNLQKVDL